MKFAYRGHFLQDVGLAEYAELDENLPQRVMEVTVSIQNWHKFPAEGNNVSTAPSLSTPLCGLEMLYLGQQVDTVKN